LSIGCNELQLMRSYNRQINRLYQQEWIGDLRARVRPTFSLRYICFCHYCLHCIYFVPLMSDATATCSWCKDTHIQDLLSIEVDHTITQTISFFAPVTLILTR